MTVEFTSSAEADLAAVADYIAEEASPNRADAVVVEIVSAAGRLAEMPRMGHRRPDLTDEDVLFWPVFSYLIVYRPDPRPLQVVRVVHGARSARSIGDALRRRGDDD